MRKRIFYKEAFGFLLFAFSILSAFAQDKVITGVISDQNGAPLASATISVQGGKAAAVTDANGAFKLTVPSGTSSLIISYVGTKDMVVSIAGKTNLLVTLEVTDTRLNEVVVVGYGKARKANLTTAQTSVSAAEINKTVNTTIEQAIQGRAAGVYVTQNSGQPGGGISVNIRGISSLNATQPLYVIDGVQIQSSEDVSYGNTSSSSPLAGLNPSDIEDIQILQGPSATAIYGSRASNGVILVTTKRGKAGDVKINYSFQHNIQTPPKHLDVMNLQQYAQMVKEYHLLAGGTTPQEFLDPSLLGKGTDWQKELFNNAAMDKHQINLSGGNNSTTYYLSGEYLNQDGVAEGSGFKRYGFRLNVDNKPRDWVTLGVNLSYNQTNENLVTTNYGNAESPLIANALRLTPQIPVKNLNGSWGGSDPVNGANQYAPINPIALANLITNKNTKRQFLGGLNLGINITKGLVFRTSVNANTGNGVSTYYTPTYQIDQWHYNSIASLQSGTYTSWYWNWNQLLEYSKQIGKHNFNLMVSHEAQESEYKALSATRTGFLTNDIFDVNAGDPLTATNGGGTYPWSMESYLGRFNYNYDNRYLLTASMRRDGSPNFGSDNRWGNFPSISAAWRVSQEEFFKIPFISELKLRYETGLTGNQGNGSGIFAALSTGPTPWGTGFLPSTFTNPKLQWEETKTNNFGFNLGILKNRISIEADFYRKNTDNLLMNASLPWYLGTNGSPGSVGAPLVNAGSLKTNGWNLTINSTNMRLKNGFKWETNFNISSFKSIVESLNSGNAFIERNSWWMNNWTQRAAIGFQPWLFRGYIEEGLFQSIDEIANSAVPVDNNGVRRPIDEQNGIWVGDVKYRDINGDGIIDINDQTNIGNPWPKLSGGLTNSFSYKNFDLSILVTATFGNDIYNFTAAANSNPNNVNLSRNFLLSTMEYAKLTEKNGEVALLNPGTTIPRISNNPISSDNNFGKITSRFVEDGSYVRIKNISLSYNFPTEIFRKLKAVKGAKATIGVQNIYTFTKYKGFDPEIGAYVGTGSSSANQAIGIDFGRYPLTPIYTASFSINF